MCIHEWRDTVCAALREGIERAKATGSTVEPTAISEWSVEFLKQLLEWAPRGDG